MYSHYKNVSQLLSVHSGYHTPIFQYADDHVYNASALHYSWKDGFQCGRLNESSNKANALNQYVMSVLSERRCKITTNFSYMQIKMKKTCSHRIIPSKTNEVIAQSKREKKRWGYGRIETERAGRDFGYTRI